MKIIWTTLVLAVMLGLSACQTVPIQSSVPTPVSPVASATGIAPAIAALDPNHLRSIADVEKVAGFHVKAPSYLPEGVLFDFATYQQESSTGVTLHFKMIHPQYGDMGAFFQIVQREQMETPLYATSCGEVKEGCELLQIGGGPVIYRLYAGGTEGLDWYTEGYSFSLLRTAGEPDKVYKEELVKVVASLR